jgi:hypothetical protein
VELDPIDESVLVNRSFDRECECEQYRKSERARSRLPELRWITSVNVEQLQLFATNDDPFEALWRELVRSPHVRAANVG